MKKAVLFLFIILGLGCSNKDKEKSNSTKNSTYKQSEMAALMLEMDALNLENKALILEAKKPKEFPSEFLKIHSATLTDPSDRNTAFEGFSEIYIKSYEEMLLSSTDSLKGMHNKTSIVALLVTKQRVLG
jgi:hypothetical protein